MNENNAKASFLILEAAEQGRPVEFAAQFLASYIQAGGIDTSTTLSFLSAVLQRTDDLINDESNIWDGLLPGGPEDHISRGYGAFTVVDVSNTDKILEFIADLTQDQAVAVAEHLAMQPNVGRPEMAASPVETDVAIMLLRNALDSGQLRDTIIGASIAEFLATGPQMKHVQELHTGKDEDMNIVLAFPLAIYQKPAFPHETGMTVYYAEGCEWFKDEFDEIWVKFVPTNGMDPGKEHMLLAENVDHIVRTG